MLDHVGGVNTLNAAEGILPSNKYIQKYSSIEGIAANTKLDVSIINHVRGRELFRDYEKVAYKIKYCGTPDFQKLEEFILHRVH